MWFIRRDCLAECLCHKTMTNLSYFSNNTSWAKENYYLFSQKNLGVFYSETVAATVTSHKKTWTSPRSLTAQSRKSFLYFFEVISPAEPAGAAHRHRCAIVCRAHLTPWERADLNLTHTTTILFLDMQHFQLHAASLSSLGDFSCCCASVPENTAQFASQAELQTLTSSPQWVPVSLDPPVPTETPELLH